MGLITFQNGISLFFEALSIRGRNLHWSASPRPVKNRRASRFGLSLDLQANVIFLQINFKYHEKWFNILYFMWIIYNLLDNIYFWLLHILHSRNWKIINKILYYCLKMRTSSFRGGPVTFKSRWPFCLVNILAKFLPL